MSEKTIWSSLRSFGISEAGTAGIMGNMYCESLLKANNVEDRCSLSDSDYTGNVDRGTYPADTFVHDAYGYGLCQWTYYTRKQSLYDLSKSKGVSISDEAMQVELCVNELKKDYLSLYNYLCTTTDVYTATARFCTEFERPAYNNISQRYVKAQEIYGSNTGTDNRGVNSDDMSNSVIQSALSPSGTGSAWVASEKQSTDHCTVEMRCLRVGDTGDDVYGLQCMLNRKSTVPCGTPDGKYGGYTLTAVNILKAKLGLAQDAEGTVSEDILQYLYS